MPGSVVLSGGGLDTYVAAWATQERYPHEPMMLLFFDYGQRAVNQEWEATKSIASALNRREIGRTAIMKLSVVEFFTAVASPLTHSEFTIEKDPQPGIAHEWVPARNTVFASLGLSFAEANQLERLVLGINATAAEAYSDNSIDWLTRMRWLVPFATNADPEIRIDAPLANRTKAAIVTRGEELGAPWSTFTWSCYEGGEKHCGLCSSCRARIKAFDNSRVKDPTEYATDPVER